MTKPTCQDCGVVVSKASTKRCAGCYAKSLRVYAYVCGRCGGPTHNPRAFWCQACHVENRRLSMICPECSGWKAGKNQRCKNCHAAIHAGGRLDWQQIVQSFNPAAFRAEITRSDLDWTVQQLADASGVAYSTISAWLTGAKKPIRHLLEAVLDVLAFETCRACKGLGRVDPTQARRQALEQRVAPQPILPRPRPILRVATPPPGPLHVGELIIDPGTRMLRLGSQEVELTRAETALIVALASQPDCLLTHQELAQVAGAASPAAANTHMNRAKVKLRQIGARAYLVSGKGSGLALSARCEGEQRRVG